MRDSGGGVEEEGEFDAMGLGGGHGFVISGSVEAFDVVLLGEGAADFEGAVEAGLVAAFGFTPAI